MVHLSDVRLRPRPVRFDRTRHAFDVTLEFEDHRPLYNWFIQQLGIFPSSNSSRPPSLTYTLLSKRKTAEAGAGEVRQRMGRSAHANIVGNSRRGYPARQFAISAPPSGIENKRLARIGHARALHSRGPQQARATRDGRFAPVENRDR